MGRPRKYPLEIVSMEITSGPNAQPEMPKERDARVRLSISVNGDTQETVIDIKDFADTVPRSTFNPKTVSDVIRQALRNAFGDRLRDVP